MADWKSTFSDKEREAVVHHMTRILGQSAMGPGATIPLQLYERLFEAAKAFETHIWNRVNTKEEYALMIKEKITSISNAAHRDVVPTPVQIETPKAQRAVIMSPPPDRMMPLIQVTEGQEHLIKVENGIPNAQQEDYSKLLALPEDIYKNLFYPHRHYNFVGQKGEETYLIAVLASPVLGIFKGLKIHKLGTEQLAFQESELDSIQVFKAFANESVLLIEKMKIYFNNKDADSRHWYVTNPAIAEDILNVEKKHPQDDGKKLKIGVIYSRANQVTAPEMFNNKPSELFQEFVDSIGEKISLNGWTGFRGDFGKDSKDDSYFKQWKGFDIMYHISTLMNAEQHRRLIGNDVCVIVFQESTSVDPIKLDLGQVPQVYCVVQPYITPNQPTRYRVAFYSRKTIPSVKPDVPKNHLFTKDQITDFLLAKLINCKFATMKSPPLDRLFYVPRAATLLEIADKYPAELQKGKSKRELQQERELLKQSTDPSLLKKLVVEIKEARNLMAVDSSGTSDPFVVLKIEDQKFKSQVQKMNCNPKWNEEAKFDLTGMNLTYTDLIVTVKDWNRVANAVFLGRVVINLGSVERFEGNETWFTLLPKVKTEETKALGEVLLRVRIVTGSD